MSRLYPCVYCTEDGYCKKYSDEEVTSWCVQSPCKDEKPSNADRIRAMSDEELAEWLDRLITHCNDGPCFNCFMQEACLTSVLEWLKQEVMNDG